MTLFWVGFLVLAVLLTIVLYLRGRGNHRAAPPAPPPVESKVIHRAGMKVVFGCGHEEHRMALLRLPDGSLVTRAVVRAESEEYNCHQCYLRTGESKVKRE